MLAFFATVKARLVTQTPADQVTSLPGAPGDIGTMFAGHVPVWPECDANLFYWFTEKKGGSTPGETPVMIWLNGGPGASSMTGFLVENIGPFTLGDDGLEVNPYAWTESYNLLVIDNPVGTGFSNTTLSPECYASTLEKVAKQFYAGVRKFFDLHMAYSTNPLWITGESYAGTYIPFIATEFHMQSFPFEGVIIGNGVLDPPNDITTVADYAFEQGLVDEQGLDELRDLAQKCAKLARKDPSVVDPVALSKACKAVPDTAYGELAGGVFQYDTRFFYDVFDTATKQMGAYLNQPEVRDAVHVGDTIWTSADEVGPVAVALGRDGGRSVTGLLSTLLDEGYKMVFYNGIFDGSPCNHRANAKALTSLQWNGRAGYAATTQKPWRLSEKKFLGYTRVFKNMAFVLITNSGHLVPMNQPDNYRTFLDEAVSGEIFKRW